MAFEVGENRLIPHKLDTDNVTVTLRVQPEGTKDTITTTSDPNITVSRYIPNSGSLTVFQNGSVIYVDIDYTEDSISSELYSTSITLNENPSIGDVIIVIHGNSTLTEGVNYRRINSRIVQLTQLDADDYPIEGGNVWGQIVDWGAQNPTRFIDKRTGETGDVSAIVNNVEFWHPSQGYHYSVGWQTVDLFNDEDPALYTNSENTDQIRSYAWREEKQGVVWFDQNELVYKPYYDDVVFSNFDLRKKIWGELADWAEIKLYEWVRSDVPPEEWDELAEEEEGDITIDEEIRKTGRVRKLVYENVAEDVENDDPIWELEETESQRYDPLIDGVPYGNRVYVFTTTFDAGEIVNVYTNGFLHREDQTIGDNQELVVTDISDNDIIDIVHIAHEPTEEEIEEGLYKYDYPHTQVEVFDIRPEAQIIYFFWVQNTTVARRPKKLISLLQASQGLADNPFPFMFFSKFEQAEVVNETNSRLELPARFEQATAKGLRGKVNADERFTLRFTRDFTLRDSMEEGSSPLELKDKHTEWKLIRREQTSKIDRELWDKITECVVGFKLDAPDESIPSLQRQLYDEQYDTQTRYGLGEDQAFTEGQLAIETIIAYLTDSRVSFEPIDIDTFFRNYSFDSTENIIESMDIIYNTFPTQNVNDIYFQVLLDAFSVKNKYEDIFKTSFIALTGVRIFETELSTQ